MNEEKYLKEVIEKYDLDDISSEILYSKDKRKFLFVNPYGWESMSNIYIYNTESKDLILIHKWSEKLACKYVQWESEDTILAILGYTYGTISIGGNLYRINIKNFEKELLVKFDDNIQITNFELKDKLVNVYGIQYTDDNYSNEIPYTDSFKI